MSAIFDTLVRRDPSGRFQAALAANWQAAPDARQWRFNLRPDISFHNGDSLTSTDVVASLRRACSPEVGGELGTEGVWASYLGDAEFTAPSPLQVNITTGRPMADLLDLLVAIPILPASVLAKKPLPLIGTGPYQLEAASATQVRLNPFAGAAVRQPAGSDPFVWHAEPAEAARVEALLSGKAQLITHLSQTAVNKIQAAGAKTLAHDSNMCVAFLFNLKRGAATNRKLRQAINYAVDVDKLIGAAHQGAAKPLNGPLTPRHFGCDEALSPYPHDPAKAITLLQSIDFDGGLQIDAPTTLPDEAPLLCEMIQADLAAVGIEASIRFHEDRTAYAHMVKAKQIADVCCFDSSPLSTYRVLREKLDSTVAGPWWQGYHNEEVNQLLVTAARTVDNDAREQLYMQAYRLLHDDAPWLFLYRPTYQFGLAPGVTDVTIGCDGLLRWEK